MTKKKRTTKKRAATPRKAGVRKARGSSPLRMQTERVKLNRGGYDSRGKYWGVGEKLWRVSVIDPATDIYVDEHTRAPNQREAKAKVTAHMMRSLSLREAGGAELTAGERAFLPAARTHARAHALVRPTGRAQTQRRYEDEPIPEAINLEGLSDSALRAVSRDRKADRQLRELAGVYIDARDARIRGMIDDAMQYEDRAQALYDRLPAHLRW
jgi:hypothetical protein